MTSLFSYAPPPQLPHYSSGAFPYWKPPVNAAGNQMYLPEAPSPFFTGPGQAPYGYYNAQPAFGSLGAGGIGSGTGGGPVTFPNYGTGGGSGSAVPRYTNGVLDPSGKPLPYQSGGGGYGNDIAVPGSGGVLPGGDGAGGGFGSVIQDLITPGLVPDVARQGAELAAGRGVAGSPAGASTAVRMSEQDYLTRLGLANTLLTGESQRRLPYDITPYQQQLLALQQQQLQNQRDIGLNRLYANSVSGFGQPRRSGGGGGYGGGGYSASGYGGGGSAGFSYPGIFGPTGGIGAGGSPFGGASNSYLFGLGGGGGQSLTLDDIYEELGFGNFGSLPGDQTTEPPDYSYDMWD